MAEITEFPHLDKREWREWETLIHQKLSAEGVERAVVVHAMPRIRQHWAAVFEPIDLELPKRPVPGRLTAEQAKAIQALIDTSAQLVLERLQIERRASFERLIRAEVALSRQALLVGPLF